MINKTHLNVLLLKDFLTLRRNTGFIAGFFITPLFLMSAFIGIQTLVNKGKFEGSLMEENFYYTSTQFMLVEADEDDEDDEDKTFNTPFADVFPFDPNVGDYGVSYASSLATCTRRNRNRYWYSKVMVVAEDEQVRENLKTFVHDYVLKSAGFPNNWTVEAFATQEEGFNDYKKESQTPYCFGITFNKFDLKNDDYDIEFHWSKEQLPDTNKPIFNKQIKSPNIRDWLRWKDTGATVVYPYMTEFIARYKKGIPFNYNSPLYNQSMGYSPFTTSKFDNIAPRQLENLIENFPFFFMIIMLIPFYYIVSKLSSEKESKTREGMKMMGLNDSTYYLAWFLFYLSIIIFTALLNTIMARRIFINVSLVIFFIWNVIYGLTLYGQAFVITSFLPSKKSSAIAATLFHIISFYSYFTVKDPGTSSTTMYMASLFPNICMTKCVNQLFFFNYQTLSGLTPGSMYTIFENYSFGGGLGMMFFDMIFWACLGLYCDQVVPSDFGVAKPWNFLCKSKKSRKSADVKGKREIKDIEHQESEKRNFENVSDSLKKQQESGQCLAVRDLVKEFGKKRAVDGTSLTMYNGQIFALLGHNGAGKTTTLSMLTGLLEPTDGYASVQGLDIFNDMDEFRKNLGVCPQHDVLFEFLTPEDHLRLFASFKGTPENEIEALVQKMIADIELDTVKTQEARTLSGGQKRKLSVAIAMIGNSKIVMLDEPTSGMDTSARRKLWEMLKNNKQGRIIVLTTHYMDEADILGDRIAIMAEGKVVCTGSSLFLKNRYGVGYNLIISKKTRDPAPQIDKFVMEKIDNAKKLQEVSSEISYQLPTSSSKQFKNFFQEFDKSLDKLGIRSYGVGITTLEEVFLKIGHGEEIEEANQKKRDDKEDLEKAATAEQTANKSKFTQEMDDYSIANDKGSAGFCSQFCAILRKKILMQIRDRKTLAIDMVFPVLLIMAGLVLSTISFFKNGESRVMTPFMYADNLELVFNENSKLLSATDKDNNIKDFMTNNFLPLNASAFELHKAIVIEDDIRIFDQAGQLDKNVYDMVFNDEVRHKPFFGHFYVQSLNQDVTRGISEYSGILFLNATAQDMPAAFGGFAHTAFLRHYLKYKPTDKLDIKFTYQPFPISQALESLNKTIAGFNCAMLMAIAWMMISDSLIQSIIKERQRFIKHQLMISGCSLKAYWLGSYVADMVFQSIASGTGILGVYMFDLDVKGVEYLMIVMIFANPPFIYFLTFMFDKDETGSLALKLIYFSMGQIAPIAISVLSVIDESSQWYAELFKWWFYPFPIFSLSNGYMAITQRDLIAVRNDLEDLEPLDYVVGGLPLRALIFAIFLYWILIYCLENKIFDIILCRRGSKVKDIKVKKGQLEEIVELDVDPDIVEEAERVRIKKAEELPVRVNDISKNYDKVQAVKTISFGLEFGECFALLGVSGAGKTTVFKCLTGEVYPTTGELQIIGNDITTNAGFQEARKQIGYCPQFDAIFDGLTVREHLEIYAALKGIRKDLLKPLIIKAIEEMDLLSYEHIHANNLSGGNKRKMSVAMAIIGNPPLVFLDEPSTGVDPQAKRFMWNIVSKISTLRKKSAVIITTHSMEEAEALCTKMGIMVDGEFKCFGSSQHIKDKYGTGYEIELKIRTLSEADTSKILEENGLSNLSKLTRDQAIKLMKVTGFGNLIGELTEEGIAKEYEERFKSGHDVNAQEFLRWFFTEGKGTEALLFLESKFKEFSIFEHYSSSWKLKVSRDNYSIGYLFGMMEDIQSKYDISEYSVAQTTLEQIFNNFAMSSESAQASSSLKRAASLSKKEAAKAVADAKQNQIELTTKK